MLASDGCLHKLILHKLIMYGSHQLCSAESHQAYIFDIRSLSAIELSLRKTINHRFNAKIHFRTRLNPTPASPAHYGTPLAQVL